MEIYLLRHGIAEEGHPGMRDADRALTADGRKKLIPTLRVARKAGFAPDLILTSPYVRARQTAEIAAEHLGYSGDLLESAAFTPGSTPQAAWDEIRLHKTVDQLLLVGHEPLFSALGAFLMGSSSVQIDFKKGAILRVDVDRFAAQPRGVLRWMLTARLAGG
jgi:phosphohistidine phosphatase